jgi:hypothetical protein
VSTEPDKQSDHPQPRRSLAFRATLNAFIGAAAGMILGLSVTWVPGWYVLGGRDVTWIVGTAEFALIGAALAAAIEVIPALTERLSGRKQ